MDRLVITLDALHDIATEGNGRPANPPLYLDGTMMTHPDCPVQTLADAWQDEVPQLMPLPAGLDGYI